MRSFFVLSAWRRAYVGIDGGWIMLVVKKTLVLGAADTQQVSGMLRLETFRGETTCRVQLYGIAQGYLCVRVADRVILCQPLGRQNYTALSDDLQGEIQAIVLSDDQVVCAGSTQGIGFAYGNFANMARDCVHKEMFVPNELPEEQDASDIEQAQTDAETNAESVEQQASDAQQGWEMTPQAQADVQAEEQAQTATEQAQTQTAQQTEQPQPTRKRAAKKQCVCKNSGVHSQAFYLQVQNSLDEIMQRYPHDTELEKVIPDSEWVRVPTVDDEYYVVGIVQGEQKVLCYGVPDRSAANPPECEADCRQWLQTAEDGSGYWMMYQDADTGEILSRNPLETA